MRCAICGNEPDEHGWKKCKVCGGLFCDRCVGIHAKALKLIELEYANSKERLDEINANLICSNCIVKIRQCGITEDIYKYWSK